MCNNVHLMQEYWQTRFSELPSAVHLNDSDVIIH